MSETQEPGDGLSSKAKDFFSLWSAAFLGSKESADLNSVLKKCVEDWLGKASRPGDQDLLPNRPTLTNRPTELNRPPTERRSNQTRQIQRHKLKSKPRFTEATRLRKFFTVYPRRAVRKILGERSLSYTGTAEEAEKFLKETYVRSPPHRTSQTEARTLFDGCSWTSPSDDQLSELNSPPTSAEIALRLSRATYTTPGEDQL